MYELTHHQAQNIVDRMMKDIPYNINIMDKTGVIIGSGNKKGLVHYIMEQWLPLNKRKYQKSNRMKSS